MGTKYIVNNVSGQTINGETFQRPYKVYTALLTQNGSSEILGLLGGDLTIGVTYIISTSIGNPDWTNVGAPNNEVGTYFVATGTTPNSWGTPGESELIYNTGAPVVTVLENTIGNVYWTFNTDGIYYATLTGAFINNKTWLSNPFGSGTAIYGVPALNDDLTNSGKFVIVTRESSDNVRVTTLNQPEDIDNNVLQNFPIEIRVYN